MIRAVQYVLVLIMSIKVFCQQLKCEGPNLYLSYKVRDISHRSISLYIYIYNFHELLRICFLRKIGCIHLLSLYTSQNFFSQANRSSHTKDRPQPTRINIYRDNTNIYYRLHTETSSNTRASCNTRHTINTEIVYTLLTIPFLFLLMLFAKKTQSRYHFEEMH